MAEWFAARKRDFTVLAARDASGFLGYATYGPFRAPSGYRTTAEHSLYVREEARGRGIGKALLAALIEKARAQGLHVLIGGADSDNAPASHCTRSSASRRRGACQRRAANSTAG